MTKPKQLRIAIADQANRVNEALDASLCAGRASTSSMKFWAIPGHPRFQVFLSRNASSLALGFAVEQQPGVWHDIGNFWHSEHVADFRWKLGFPDNFAPTARITKYYTDNLSDKAAEFIQMIPKAVDPTNVRPIVLH